MKAESKKIKLQRYISHFHPEARDVFLKGEIKQVKNKVGEIKVQSASKRK